MAKLRDTLQRIQGNLDESMGVRNQEMRPTLSPVAKTKDVGRRALRSFGTLDIEKLIPDPEQPRAVFSNEELEQLANSIREKGQLQPIRVRWSEELATWIIISGERRYRASKQAGLQSVNCQFVDGTLSKSEVLQQQLIENLLREDLKPVEEAKAFDQLRGMTGWNSKQLAEAIRVTRSKVTRSLALLRLPDQIRQQVEDGKLSAKAAYELSKLSSDDQILAAFNSLDRSGDYSAAKAQNQVKQRRGKSTPSKTRTKLTFASEHGIKVVVSASKQCNYEQVEEALSIALAEVRHRLDNNTQL
ncbi:Chromosome-partitioning protein Spo0J [Rubripirellula tenax]|uniref:Chromosome-partitioning protein Spo0J n=1 Tax=Rubripirellula tenax TaxID=2528015 RepID=A0A5C6F280_9BACT|nr:ParB/RepB/Spo0J family partition protein [Rubripirellula tenax]TWU54714.1 Chromosome-partitioning protein Spo0J [Rubripirellula tenax]